MKSKKLILISLFLLLLVGCSSIPLEDRVQFCEEKGMVSYDEYEDGFICSISDLDYKFYEVQQICNKSCGGINEKPN